MIHHTFSWQSNDGLTLYAQSWEPEGEISGVVCLVHGLGEHSNRYNHVAHYFVEHDFALVAFDLRGHGRSEGQRGHTSSLEMLMKDIDLLIKDASLRFPGLPVFLYGHSLGGILVLNYVLRRRPELAGVIASAPGLRTAIERQKSKKALVKSLGAIMPKMSLPSGLDPSRISRSKHVVEEYISDPLVHDRVTLGMGLELMKGISWAYEHASEFPLPLLVIHGLDDKLAFPEGSQEFARLVKCPCTLELWDGFYHELHNESERYKVFDYCLRWMRSKMPPPTPGQSPSLMGKFVEN